MSQIVATDIDKGVNQDVTFSEVSSNEFLEIDATGLIQIKSNLDYERTNETEYVVSTLSGISDFIFNFKPQF